jgi:ribosomal protein S18 acetylase RimI-like enzyme
MPTDFTAAAPDETTGFGIRPVPYDHPDAWALIPRLQEFYVERYGSPDDDEMDAAMFDPPAGAFFVGYLDGTPVATGAWRREGVERLGSDNTAEIKRMYVVPEQGGRGFARRMLAHLERTAAEAGYDVLVLSTGAHQPEAIALYESSGYERVPSFGHYEGSELNRAFAKRLRL